MNENVARGIELLDQKMPGWAAKIDLDILRMSSCHVCILGQLYTEYGLGLSALGLSKGRDHGFDVPTLFHSDHEVLTAAWREAIEARRERLSEETEGERQRHDH